MNKSIPFPPAGEGVSIAFSLRDLAALESKLTPEGMQPIGGEQILLKLANIDFAAIDASLATGLKNPDGTSWQGDVSKLDLVLQDTAHLLINAISLRVFGKMDVAEGESDEA